MAVDPTKPKRVVVVHGVQSGTDADQNQHQLIEALIKTRLNNAPLRFETEIYLLFLDLAIPFVNNMAYKETTMKLERITIESDKLGGVPCIRGLRIPVATVVGLVASGVSEDDILRDYPDLEREDIGDALRFAAEAVRERQIPLVKAS